MSPPFIFRIDEFTEHISSVTTVSHSGSWIPHNVGRIRRTGAIFICGILGTGSALQMGDHSLPARFQPQFWMSSSASGSFNGLEGLTKGLPIYLAICAFASSVTQLYYLCKHNLHQQRYLMGGILMGISLGLALERELQRAILNVMPWFILLSLLVSSAAHGIWHGRTIDSATDRTSLSTVPNKKKMDVMDDLVEEAPL